MKRTSVAICIPAYNEEKNIANVINDSLRQENTNHVIRGIYIYSDHSTDDTNLIVNRLAKQHQNIHLYVAHRRRGKIHGLNYFFKNVIHVDALILIDADALIQGDSVFDKLVSVMVSDKKAQVVAAHQIPIKPKKFFGKLMYAMFSMWDYVRWSIPNYDHVQNLYSGATVVRGSLARTMHIPTGSGDERVYIYLKAKELDGFRYCKTAVLKYTMITTFQDYLSMMTRKFGTPVSALEKEFGPIANSVHVVPRQYLIKGILTSFIKQPIYTPIAIVLAYIVGHVRPKSQIVKADIWKRTESVK